MNKPKRIDLSNSGMALSFTQMVDEDIQKCTEYLNGDRDEIRGKELHLELITKYPAYISHFGDSLFHYNADLGFISIEYFDEESMIHNLTVMKSRLIAFKNYGYKDCSAAASSREIVIENNLTAMQSQVINISFEDVKRHIEDMTGLTEIETNEAIHKIDEIKTIVELKESKKTKWQKMKPIIIWLADKSVDVGIALLPLLLKIGS